MAKNSTPHFNDMMAARGGAGVTAPVPAAPARPAKIATPKGQLPAPRTGK
jgi:hypothetical protein